MKAYVYILKDSNGKFYIGSTSDIKRRIKQHNSGHTATTRKMKFPKLVLSQEFNNLNEARKIEKKFKKLKRKDYIEQIVKEKIIKMKT